MVITLDNVYQYLEENKKDLNFIPRNEIVTEMGTSKFSTLFYNDERKDVPDELRFFLEKIFNVRPGYYDFIQVQKYEVGEYILPHRDAYPLFNLLMLSTSDTDGLTLEGEDNLYKFHPDRAGTFINLPKYKWHWVNPVREKTRYTAVVAALGLPNTDAIAELLA